LVRPFNLDINPNKLKVSKGGRPRKIISETTKNEKKQDELSKQLKPEDVIQIIINIIVFWEFNSPIFFYRLLNIH